ncbi:hypothetical protein Tco_1509424 [Tanacetum coccineum]
MALTIKRIRRTWQVLTRHTKKHICSAQFHGIISYSWSSRIKQSCPSRTIESEYISKVLVALAQSYRCGLNYRIMLCIHQHPSVIREDRYNWRSIFTRALPENNIEFNLPGGMGMKSMKPETLKCLQDDKDE